METDKESIKRIFPNMAQEIQSSENSVSAKPARKAEKTETKVDSSQSFTRYIPDVIDFLRRCDTKEQAEEIIAYMEKRGEIERQYAQKLRKQLREKGVRSFGSKKEEDYYLKHGEL